MKNQIEKVRKEIKRYFDPDSLFYGDPTVTYSSDNKFRLESESYRQNKPGVNWYVAKVRILDNISNEILLEFLTDDSSLFHSWLKVGEIDFLVCAENMCGGQTVIDVTNRIISSYADDTDGFIWTEFFISPDSKKLATIGCIWACPYEIKIYDFSDPMDLPLKVLKSVELIGNETITGWLDNSSFKTFGYDDENTGESFKKESVTVKKTSPKKVIERVIFVHT